MASSQPEYINAAALFINTMRGNRLGMSEWPTNLWLQEQRIAYLQSFLSDAPNLLRDIYDDYHTPNVMSNEHLLEAHPEQKDPMQVHNEMWETMYNAALTLTEPSLLTSLSLLGADRTAPKTVAYLEPIRIIVQSAFETSKTQGQRFQDEFKDALEEGPETADEVAQTERYQRWKRSFGVLGEVVRSLYDLIEKIGKWLVAKMEEVERDKPKEAALAKKAAEKARWQRQKQAKAAKLANQQNSEITDVDDDP